MFQVCNNLGNQHSRRTGEAERSRLDIWHLHRASSWRTPPNNTSFYTSRLFKCVFWEVSQCDRSGTEGGTRTSEGAAAQAGHEAENSMTGRLTTPTDASMPPTSLFYSLICSWMCDFRPLCLLLHQRCLYYGMSLALSAQRLKRCVSHRSS